MDSLNSLIPSVKVSLGTLEFEPTISTRLQLNERTTQTPYLTSKGIWTFSHKNSAHGIVSGNQFANTEGVRASIEAGLEIAHRDGLTFGISGIYDGIGSSALRSWSAKAKLRYRR